MAAGDHETVGGGFVVIRNSNPQIIEKTALAIQLEHLGASGNKNSLYIFLTTNFLALLTPIISNGNYSMRDAMQRMLDGYGIVVNRDLWTTAAGDVDGLTNVPSGGFIRTGYLYRSEVDSLDWYLPKGLERLARAALS